MHDELISTKFRRILLATSLILVSVIGAGEQPTAALSPPVVVFVVGNANTLPVDDLAPYAELVAAGFDVRVVDDDAVADAEPDADADLVAISASVIAQRVGAHFNDTLAPVLVWEPALFSRLGMTGAGARQQGIDTGETMLDIVDPSHPMAADLADRISVGRRGATFSFGVPSAAASVVATIVNRPGRPAIFHYAAGDEMVAGVAPAARTGFYLGSGAPKVWLDEGRALFRAAVEHTLGDAGDGDAHADDTNTPRRSALFIAGGPTPTTDEQPAVDRLTELEFDVVVADDHTVRAGDAVGADLIVISSTSAPYRLDRDLAALTVPMIVWEAGFFDELGFTSSGVQNGQASGTSVRIVDPDHPIVAGLDGDVYTTSTRIGWGIVEGDVEVVALHPKNASKAALFLYDTGAALHHGIAPARRVGVFLGDDGPALLTPNGWTMFDRAVGWATGANDAPVVDAGPDITGLVSNPQALGGTVRDDGQPVGAPLTSEWTGPAEVLFADPNNPATTVDATSPGTYTLVLQADDSLLTSSDTVTVTFGDNPLTAAFETRFESGPSRIDVHLDAAASTDPGGEIIAYDWTFDDEHTASGRTTSHSFAAHGEHSVTLTATDNTGAADTVTEIIDVPNLAPTATPAADATVIAAPGVVHFDGTESIDHDGTLVSYHWDFGDGTTPVDAARATHEFTASGSFRVHLTVTDDAGASSTARIRIVVGATGAGRAEAGLIALYDFAGGPSTTVSDVSGVGEPLDLVIVDDAAVTHLAGGGIRLDTPTTITSPTAATKIIDAVGRTNEITVELFIDPRRKLSNEPGRLVTISPDDEQRNVALNQGQKATSPDRFESRLRTTHSGASGTQSAETPVGTSTDRLTHLVFTRSSDGVQRLYLDGQLLDVARVGGDFSSWNPDWPLTFGAETTGEYPWLGDFHLAAFYDRALSHREICTNGAAGPGRDIAGTNRPPTSCLLGDRTGGPAPHTVAVDSGASSDLDGNITTTEWDFGDGTTSTDVSPAHTYSDDGDYTLTLTVIDDDGARTTSTTTIVVRDAHVAVPQPENFGETLGVRASGSFFDIAAFERFEADLNRPIALTVQFLERRSVSGMRSSSAGLFTRDDSDLLLVDERVTLSLTVPLGFGEARPRSTAGIAAVKANLVETASGAHDDSYLLIAQRLVDAGYDDAILRVGNEFNGTFHPYSSRHGNHDEFIAAWRHVHDVFESVSPGFRFDWTSLRGAFGEHGPVAWPGDDYVDFVGVDIYWRPQSNEPDWSDPTWDTEFRDVMQAHLDFAVSHGKQVSYPEWGVIGVDEPRFVEHMYDWFVDLPTAGPGSLAYQSYFNGGNSKERLADNPDTKSSYDLLFGSPVR